MRNVIIAYVALILIIVIIALFRNNIGGLFKSNTSLPFQQASKESLVNINGYSFKVEVADEPSEREIGLSNKASLEKEKGMLFVFENKTRPAFWMRDMKFPIDIIFIDDDTVVDVYSNVPIPVPNQPISAIPTIEPKKEANYVLEINAGKAKELKIKEGNKVEIKNIK